MAADVTATPGNGSPLSALSESQGNSQSSPAPLGAQQPANAPLAQTPSSRPLPRASRPCDHCRRRKTRCVKSDDDGPCELCRRTHTPCTFINRPEKRKRPPTEPRPNKSSARTVGPLGPSIEIGEINKLSLPGRIEVPPMKPSDIPLEEETDPPLIPMSTTVQP
jgi:hypothetical protein